MNSGNIALNPNTYLENVIKSFEFLYSLENKDRIRKKLENILNNDTFLILHYQETIEYCQSFFICFDNSMIIIQKAEIPYFFHNNIDTITIYYITDITKEKFQELINKPIKIVKISFPNEYVIQFLEKFPIAKRNFLKLKHSKNLLKTQIDLIIFYLLQKSFINTRIDRIINIQELFYRKPENKIFNINEFIILSSLGSGSSGNVKMAYHIGTEKLYGLKFFNFVDDDYTYERELKNYKEICHPFIPRLYGTVQSQRTLVMDYIEGFSLLHIKKINLNIYDKYMVILELMLAIQTIHEKKLIYRDLKPDNVIIDKNKTAVLIDFNRMIENNDYFEGTMDFAHAYIAPEIINGKAFSFQADIYSIGLLIYYIIFEKNPAITYNDQKNLQFHEFQSKYPLLQKICQKCTNKEPNERFNIKNLIYAYLFDFLLPTFSDFKEKYDKFPIKTLYYLLKILLKVFSLSNDPIIAAQIEINDSNINSNEILANIYYFAFIIAQNFKQELFNLIYAVKINKNHSNAQFLLGQMHFFHEFVQRNINKAIHYLTLSADKNHINAQFLLGQMHYFAESVPRDMNKAIHYLTLSADQNHSGAQFFLGVIYYQAEYVKRDVKKSIYYLTLSAYQNNSDSQYLLGKIYYFSIYVQRDIYKAIHYFTLSADNNNKFSQFILGCFYSNRDMKKAIYYLTLSANQNYSEAQLYLAKLYKASDYIPHNIENSMYYLTLAADQKNSEAQFLLGKLYYLAENVPLDIDKALAYLKCSANQNNSDAQYFLGEIYYNAHYVPRDMKYAIFNLTLSANQNNLEAQFLLGKIYFYGEFVTKSIDKALYFLTLSAEQNHAQSQFLLGAIYFKAEYVQLDMKKALFYLKSSASQNNIYAQYLVGQIYFYAAHVPQDMKNAIYYITISADQGFAFAQYFLGEIYYTGNNVPRNINKAVYYLTLSANQYFKQSYLLLGEIYSTKVLKEPDFKKAIHYYKEGSSFNDNMCKNNLAVISANGLDNDAKIPYAIELFKEAINKKNDIISMFNLSLIYFYEESFVNISECIRLLIKSLNNGFNPALEFLCIVLCTCMNKNISIESIESKIKNFTNESTDLPKRIYYYIKKYNFEKSIANSNYYLYRYLYKNRFYMYSFYRTPIPIDFFLNHKFEDDKENNEEDKRSKLSSAFYEGFGISIN